MTCTLCSHLKLSGDGLVKEEQKRSIYLDRKNLSPFTQLMVELRRMPDHSKDSIYCTSFIDCSIMEVFVLGLVLRRAKAAEPNGS